MDDLGNETSDIIKYSVDIANDNGLSNYTVWVNGDYVHFVVNENRYRMNLSTNTVDRLVVQDIPVTTVDFSTSYNPTQLRDNLAQNVRNTVLNQIIQRIIDSKETGGKSIDIVFHKPIGLYLDVFTDAASLDNYIIANNGLGIDSDECVKFSQIYKNNLEDIDESNMVNGNIYGYLKDKVDGTFGTNSDVLVVDSPSIEVKRIDDVDTFTYKVLMDVYIMQNKEWMQNHSTLNGKYVIANAIVKDMECSVEITPIYNSGNGSVTYSANYSVDISNPYNVEYNQIVYNYNGNTKHMTTPETRNVQVNFSDISGLDLTYSTSGKLKDRTTPTTRIITDEIISKEIQNIFSKDDYTKMFNRINNAIEGGDSTKEIIDNSVVDNPDQSYGIWQLGTSKVLTAGELINENRGQTYIRGQLYNVSDDDEWLNPSTGSQRYAIQPLPTNAFDSKIVIQVLVPSTSNKFQLNYLKSWVEDSNILTFTTNPAEAQQFDTTKKVDSWIERFFGTDNYKTIDDKTYFRSYFGYYNYPQFAEDPETKNIAASDVVLVEKSYVYEHFSIDSIGSGNDRKVFLKHIESPGLPSRFHAKSKDEKTFDT